MTKNTNISESSLISRSDAIDYLGLTDKEFKNYFENSKEIIGEKIRGRWYFDKNFLDSYKKTKEERTVNLTIAEYEECFEFAIKMVYGGLSLNGIRGQRSEVQAADDVILGILAEHAIKDFFKNKFNVDAELDQNVHTSYITPQDIVGIKTQKESSFRKPKLGIGIKASKMKSGFLVLGSNEIELEERKSDVYMFARVGLPSDHLFRILREHSFFSKASKYMDTHDGFRKIEELKEIPVWICGFVYADDLEKVRSIPGQDFDGHRYVKSVGKMKNSDEDWANLIKEL